MNGCLARRSRWSWVLLLALGCDPAPGNGPEVTDPPVTGQSLAALRTAEGCDEVLDLLRRQTMAAMEKAVDRNRDMVLEWLTQGYGFCWYAEDGGMPPSAGGNDPGEGAKDYSTTNTQEEGVDEADFVKNDSQFLYILADGRLQVIDAWPAAETRKVAEVPIEGTPTRLYVAGDIAVVYSGLGPVTQGGEDPWGGMGGFLGMPYQGASVCTYGYDCEFTGDHQRLKITVLKASRDRKDWRLLREIRFSGSYLNSRRIAEAVHTVLVFPEVAVPGTSYWPEELKDLWNFCGADPIPYTEDQIRAMFDGLKEENRKKIEESDITDYLPGIEDTRHTPDGPVTESGLLSGCQGFYLSQAGDGRSFLSVVSFRTDELGSIAASTIVGRPGAVYGSSEALYVAERHYRQEMGPWYFDEGEGAFEATTVHKFAFGDGGARTTYRGSGAVKGRVLNQFSMDEHRGDLRIATTLGHVPDPNVHSTLSVLREKDGELVVVGMVDHIAPTEDIRSARFEGDKGFLVTFKKTDPLFAFDLSDPGNPRILGELKIPGYSTYMHFLDDGHLLSIGFDADDHGDFAYFDGLMLQVFDVTDLTRPSLVHRQVIGTRGSSSDAALDHLAFNYFPSRNLLALPIIVCEGGDDGNYGTTMTFNGLQVWRVTLDQGFELLGGIPFAEPVHGDDYWSACGVWWTQSNTQVKRSVFMEDFVYSIAPVKLQVASLADLAHPIRTIPLAEPAK